jgi:hypothetical protein
VALTLESSDVSRSKLVARRRVLAGQHSLRRVRKRE